MRHKELIVCGVFFIALGLVGLKAQESISATGGNASVSGQGSVSYSVGQVVFTVNTGTTGTVLQGVQQPFEISVISGIEDTEDISLSVLAYPNPATDYLLLRADNVEISNLSFQLFDMNGKLLESNRLSGNDTSIDMSNLLPAAYFLKVIEKHSEVKVFKIIKN